MRLTYANVVSTLALFLALTGGAALAAHRYLTHRSVGTPQLKANAVTTAKIKANAITTRKLKRLAVSTDKIKEDAVTTEKLADRAVTREKLDLEGLPFGQIAVRMRTGGGVSLDESFEVYPLSPSTYTQAPDEIDTYAGRLQVTIPTQCTAPRRVTADVLVDAEEPTKPKQEEARVVATGTLEDTGVGPLTSALEIEPAPGQSMRFEPGTATRHTVSLVVRAECEGGGSGVTAASGAVDVIATQ